MGEKLRAVFAPLSLLVFGFAALISLLDWALVIKTNKQPQNKNKTAIWLPAGLAMVAVGFLIAPRLHLLAFNPKYKFAGLYLMAAIVCVAAPAILVQEYLQASTGEMVTVVDGAAIAQHPEARFFTVGAVCLNKHQVPWHPRVSVAGDHDEDLNADLYYAVPFCGTQVWLGLHWQRTFDNFVFDLL